MAGRLERLLRDFAWGRMDEVFAAAIGGEVPAQPSSQLAAA